MNYLEMAAYHADRAEELLAEVRDGTKRHGPYAPYAATKAAAAQAHATLATYFFERAQRS